MQIIQPKEFGYFAGLERLASRPRIRKMSQILKNTVHEFVIRLNRVESKINDAENNVLHSYSISRNELSDTTKDCLPFILLLEGVESLGKEIKNDDGIVRQSRWFINPVFVGDVEEVSENLQVEENAHSIGVEN